VQSNLNPTWNQTLPFLVSPDVSQLTFSVMDKDTISDDLMGKVRQTT